SFFCWPFFGLCNAFCTSLSRLTRFIAVTFVLAYGVFRAILRGLHARIEFHRRCAPPSAAGRGSAGTNPAMHAARRTVFGNTERETDERNRRRNRFQAALDIPFVVEFLQSA